VFQPTDHNVDLSEEEFRLLRDLVHERFGLFFDDNQRSSLRSRLTGRLASLDLHSFEDYYHYLRFGPQRGEELQQLGKRVGHTSIATILRMRRKPMVSSSRIPLTST